MPSLIRYQAKARSISDNIKYIFWVTYHPIFYVLQEHFRTVVRGAEVHGEQSITFPFPSAMRHLRSLYFCIMDQEHRILLNPLLDKVIHVTLFTTLYFLQVNFQISSGMWFYILLTIFVTWFSPVYTLVSPYLTKGDYDLGYSHIF